MYKKFKYISLNPPLFLTLGFGIMILIGGILLNLPFVSKSGESVGFINALFTASSASCVTGLVVVNTAEYWNIAGQLIILFLIQIGGLGIMTLATLFPIIMSKKIGLTSRQIIREQLNVETMSGMVKLLKYVIYFTLTVELIGAVLMSSVFIPRYGVNTGIWYSIFHSISAFCNAGFDVLGTSIVPFKNNIIINIAIMLLIIIGGLGFQVTAELYQKKSIKNLHVHSKIVLLMSFILIVGGALGFLLLERSNGATIGNETTFNKVLQSLFQSVVARTAGFNSVDLSKIRESSVVLLIMLMFIGGSPGSTAGGLKTTTFGVLFISMISTIRGEQKAVVFKKTIPTGIILKSLAIVMISISLVILISFALTISEEFVFIDIFYEVVSAYATVGVSRGITPFLSDIGKIIITITMYIGRIGPLTMAYAFGKKKRTSKIEYPDESISVG